MFLAEKAPERTHARVPVLDSGPFKSDLVAHDELVTRTRS